jgi:NAD(P)-dependent dehydrogenase (short-subunit alcohol dehydrogenase family)
MPMSFSRREPVAKLLGHPVYEHPQARRQLPRMGVEDVDGQRRRRKGGQHLDQRAAGKLGSDAIGKPQEVIDRLSKLAPLERLGQPQDIADAVAFLAGPDGAWINGQTLRANGGII